LHSLTPEQLADYQFQFQDSRLATMLFRYRARNYPYTLTNQEQQQWQQYCRDKIQHGGAGYLSAEEFLLKIENLAHEHEQNPTKISVLKALYRYLQG
jgi:exodeoxyribonuclease I